MLKPAVDIFSWIKIVGAPLVPFAACRWKDSTTCQQHYRSPAPPESLQLSLSVGGGVLPAAQAAEELAQRHLAVLYGKGRAKRGKPQLSHVCCGLYWALCHQGAVCDRCGPQHACC